MARVIVRQQREPCHGFPHGLPSQAASFPKWAFRQLMRHSVRHRVALTRFAKRVLTPQAARRYKSIARKDLLFLGGQNIFGEFLAIGRCAVEHRQPERGRDRQLFWQKDDLQCGIEGTGTLKPTLGAILGLAQTTDTLAKGGALLAVYSAGLAIPFLVTALAFNRATTAFAWVKRHYAVINAIAGLLLIGMGVLPLQYAAGDTAASLGLTGTETFTIEGIASGQSVPRTLTVQAGDIRFQVTVRIDTPGEQAYYRHGGILPFVLRSLL